LRNTIHALFKKQLSEGEISSLIDRLQARGIIVVSDTKVTYELPPNERLTFVSTGAPNSIAV